MHSAVRWAAFLAAGMALPGMTCAQAQSLVQSEVTPEPDGTRTLRQSIVVAAPIQAVWEAFCTAAGWRSWGAA